MTTKTISSYYAGYNLAAKYSELDITATGRIGGFGLNVNGVATISNFGTINPSAGFITGVVLHGGSLVNQQTGFIGSSVVVGDGIHVGSVDNLGTIKAPGYAIDMLGGGVVTNGNYANPAALIAGSLVFDQGAGTATNFGTITGRVVMSKGGIVTNGGAGDTTAAIKGGQGVLSYGAPATVTNFGTIQSYARPNYIGVDLVSGGTVTNGGLTDTVARIEGATAVVITGAATVANFGVIAGTGAAAGGYGVLLTNGGGVTNGAPSDRGALIEGYEGVAIKSGAGTVTNFGSVIGQGAYNRGGVVLYAGGSVTNGSDLDRTALIEGAAGVFSEGGAGTIRNFGTIRGTGAYGGGVVLFAGGSLTNGSATDGAALIEGAGGVNLLGACTATNFGTISGLSVPDGTGVYLHSGSTLTNGASGHAGALIQGYIGVRVSGTGTVTNFGTIRGMGAPAVYFASYTDVLIVEAGCAFEGAVLGGGGTLELDTGTGTLTGLLAGGNVTVSGSMATTTFSDFGTVEIGAAAQFTASGAVTIAAGQSVIDAGSLTLGGKKAGVANGGLIEVTGSGTLTVSGAVTGKGSAAIEGGLLDFTSSFTEDVAFTGKTGILELAKSQTYTGKVTGFSKTGGTSLHLDDIAFSGGTTASYSGTKKSGVLTVNDGIHTANIALKGNYLSSSFVVASDGHGGTLVHDPAALAANLPSAGPRFIAAMAGLGAQGGWSTPARAEPWRGVHSALAAPQAHIA